MVKRYDHNLIEVVGSYVSTMDEHPHGDYVTYEDYADLKERLENLNKLVSELYNSL